MNSRNLATVLPISMAVFVLVSVGCSEDPVAPEPAPSDVQDQTGLDQVQNDPSTVETVDDAADEGTGVDSEADESDAEDASGDGAVDIADEEVFVGPIEPDGAPKILLTINELPVEMNGSQGYYDNETGPTPFQLLLPTYGFTLDVVLDRSSAWIDPDSIDVTCDAAFGEIEANAPLAGQFESREMHLRWLVPEGFALEEGAVSCTGQLANHDGEMSNVSVVSFDVEEIGERHPFAELDEWVVTFSRDYADISYTYDGDEVTVTFVREPDGERDFDEDMRLLGFQGDESGEGAAEVEAYGQVGVNDIVRYLIIDGTMRNLRTMYGVDPETGLPFNEDSVNIAIYKETDEGAPGTEYDGSFSIHGVGGPPPEGWPDLFGLASDIDVHNPNNEDDAREGWGSFSMSLARVIVENPAAQALLSEFLPTTGTPVGESDLDAVFLSEDYESGDGPTGTGTRRNRFNFQLELLTKGLASLIAHEMGHSLGLTPCGPPPIGLFGGIFDPNWMYGAVPTCTHMDLPGLNVMQLGSSLSTDIGSLLGEVYFEPLNLAY
ncbi:MAG: hypothetical protein KC561_14950, partial [Myxococcales bacterium]|nr:hypothetical protein [Myxococcales bacterium]